MVIHGHAGFPRNPGQSGGRNLLLRRSEITTESTCFGEAFHIEPAGPDTVIYQYTGLQTFNVLINFFAMFLIPGALPLPVEPQYADITIICQQLLQLSLHI